MTCPRLSVPGKIHSNLGRALMGMILGASSIKSSIGRCVEGVGQKSSKGIWELYWEAGGVCCSLIRITWNHVAVMRELSQ
eukprot:4946073-Amphidinium_carterae.1